MKTQQERIDRAVITRHFTDPRIADMITLFNQKDERGKQLLLRMAGAMPCANQGACRKEVA